MNRDEHDFSPVVSTYARVNKLTRDSIIIQMMNSSFTQGWLKTKGYHFFITADENSINEPSVYLTEDMQRLAALLKEIYNFPKAFKEADTLVRLRMGF